MSHYTGRVPAFVNRHSSLVYGLAFFGAFVSGAGSYQKTCFRRIMALENSALADLYRKTASHMCVGFHFFFMASYAYYFSEKEMQKEGCSQQRGRKTRDPTPFPSSLPKQRPQASPQTPDVSLKEGPSINMRTYTKDKSMLESKEESMEQPSAFSGGEDSRSALPPFPSPSREGDSKGK